MRVDIDVGDALQAVELAQILRGDAAVVEHAETGGAVARGVVKPGDRHERTLRIAVHDRVNRRQRRADDRGCRVEDTGQRRRVAAVEVATPLLRLMRHEVDVVSGVEQQQLVDGRLSRHSELDRAAQRLGFEFLVEHVVPVETERVRAAE